MRSRAPGIHVTDCLKALGPYAISPPFDEKNRGMAELGNALEYGLIQRYFREFDKYSIPGELALDGIPGTPDLASFIIRPQIDEILEFKLRWSNPPPVPEGFNPDNPQPTLDTDFQYNSSFWLPQTQIMAYCRMAHTLKGRLIMVFIPTFGAPSAPYREYSGVFTATELAYNWIQLKEKAKELCNV